MKIKCPSCRKTSDIEFVTERASHRKHSEIFYTYQCPECGTSYTTTDEKQLKELLT